ncbi:hypothetical protein LCGC14_1286770 [marine sediment metagenome]|uniref:30S ribosomal protein S17 n=1 Tax=marine sediment metagenome TaxID=412755 RepID=A0A0F9NA67_9ZZZZ
MADAVKRAQRKRKLGRVVSNRMDKSAVIAVDIDRMHPLYKKSLKRTVKYQAHDEKNEVQIGDLVELVETRPLSKNKRWRITKVVEKAK